MPPTCAAKHSVPMCMSKLLHLLTLLCLCSGPLVLAQSNPPWERPLMTAWSNDGITFGPPVVFQDSAGVPSAVRWKGDTLVCVFQWFRQPMNTATWDRVAVKFSFDAGNTWTTPAPIIVSGLPGGYQRPFDPTLAVLPDGRLRLYFSSSDGMPPGGMTSIVNTYSAISSDGVNFVFEPGARFDDANRAVIDPAVTFFQGVWQYAAPAGAPQDGAFHATSNDGLVFTRHALYPSDNQHNWTGNFLATETDELRFYGSGSRIWFNTSKDGFTWLGYRNTTLIGGDPTVVKTPTGMFLAIFVGPPYTRSGFLCGDTLIDPRDGRRYGTVRIGSDCWMTQNLNFGAMVPSVPSATPHSDMSDNGRPEKYAMHNNAANLESFGGLYEWNELMNYSKAEGGQGLCPPGWHVSTDAEWQRLIAVAGGSWTDPSAGHGGNALKRIGEGFGRGAGTDLVRFSALHAGDRDALGIFNGEGLRSIFWTSTRANNTDAYHYTLWAENDTIQRLVLGSSTGFACRCVLNGPTSGMNALPPTEIRVSAYPNPFSRAVAVAPSDDGAQYIMIDAAGRVIWSGRHVHTQDFSALASGKYFLHVRSADGTHTILLIKE